MRLVLSLSALTDLEAYTQTQKYQRTRKMVVFGLVKTQIKVAEHKKIRPDVSIQERVIGR